MTLANDPLLSSEQIKALMTENKKLKDAICECNKSMESSCKFLNTLRQSQVAERREFQQRHSQARTVVMQLRQQNADREQQVAELTQQLAVQSMELGNQKSRTRSLEIEIQQMQENHECEVKSLTDKLQEKSTEQSHDYLMKMRSVADECLELCIRMHDEQNCLQTEIRQLTAEKQALEAKYSTRCNQLQRVLQGAMNEKSKVSSLQDEIINLQQKIVLLQQQSDGYKEDFTTEHERLQNRVRDLEHQLSTITVNTMITPSPSSTSDLGCLISSSSSSSSLSWQPPVARQSPNLPRVSNLSPGLNATLMQLPSGYNNEQPPSHPGEQEDTTEATVPKVVASDDDG